MRKSKKHKFTKRKKKKKQANKRKKKEHKSSYQKNLKAVPPKSVFSRVSRNPALKASQSEMEFPMIPEKFKERFIYTDSKNIFYVLISMGCKIKDEGVLPADSCATNISRHRMHEELRKSYSVW